MINLEKELIELNKIKYLKNEAEIKRFDEILINIYKYKDKIPLSRLYTVFDDNTEDDEVMYGLIHLIEEFPPEVEIEEFIKSINLMVPNAKEWAKLLLIRILNHKDCRNLFINIISNYKKNNLIINKLLLEIKNEDINLFGKVVDTIISETK